MFATYGEEEDPELQGPNPRDRRRLQVVQLVLCVPRLERAERIHLPERAEQRHEGAEDSKVPLRRALRELWRAVEVVRRARQVALRRRRLAVE